MRDEEQSIWVMDGIHDDQEQTEGRGRWVGIANVQSARTKLDRNKCVDLLSGEDVTLIIKSSMMRTINKGNQCQFLIRLTS